MHISCSNTMPPITHTECRERMEKILIVGGYSGLEHTMAQHFAECGAQPEPLGAMTHSMQAKYKPGPGELDMMNNILEESNAQIKKQVDEYVEAILAQATPEMLDANGHFQLVVGNETMAGLVRSFLVERGHDFIDVVVAAAAPSNTGNYWTPEMSAAKLAYANAYDALGQRVRHHAKFTKSQPTAKARKAARKRAKAGRKASR